MLLLAPSEEISYYVFPSMYLFVLFIPRAELV